jgi:hypothetical protein
LSTVVATRPGGTSSVAGGGKSRRYRPGGGLKGEAGLNVYLQARLVGLHRQQIVAPGVEDLLTEVALAEQGVAGDDPACNGQEAQQPQGRLVFVGLAVDLDLGEDGLDLGGVSGDEMLAREVALTAATGRLAVNGEMIDLG